VLRVEERVPQGETLCGDRILGGLCAGWSTSAPHQEDGDDAATGDSGQYGRSNLRHRLDRESQLRDGL
jgi:hypothetical protein